MQAPWEGRRAGQWDRGRVWSGTDFKLQGALVLTSKGNTASGQTTGCPVHTLCPLGPKARPFPPWFALRRWTCKMGSRGKLGALPQAVKTLPPSLQDTCESSPLRRSLRAASTVACQPDTPAVMVTEWQLMLTHPEYRCISPKARVQHCMLIRWRSWNINARLDPKGKPLKK